jgi:hypothetical protein
MPGGRGVLRRGPGVHGGRLHAGAGRQAPRAPWRPAAGGVGEPSDPATDSIGVVGNRIRRGGEGRRCRSLSSCGSITRSMEAKEAGSCCASHASLVMVKLAIGTRPQRRAHCVSPSRERNAAAWGAEVVSFHSLAGRRDRPSGRRRRGRAVGARHRDGDHAREVVADLVERFGQRSPPGLRVLFGDRWRRRRVRATTRGHQPAGLQLPQLHLGRLGRRVDTGDQRDRCQPNVTDLNASVWAFSACSVGSRSMLDAP